MSEAFDSDARVERFRERAVAVKQRNLPAVGEDERARFNELEQTDIQDYAIITDATSKLVDGVLTLTVDLRPDADA